MPTATLFHLKIVVRVAALLALFGALAMAAIVLAVGQGEQQSYLTSLGHLQISQERLMPLVLAAGLFLLTVSAFVTWLIALYSSFRIAGPLHRLTRNLEQELEQQSLNRPAPIRREDRLQSHARLLGEAVAALDTHYENLGRELRAIDHDLGVSGAEPGAVLQRYRDRLQRLYDDVHY